jgi:heme A synthase
MFSAIIPVLVMLVGLLIWAFASNPKAAEAGRILFFCGAFVTTQVLAGTTMRFGR